MHDIQILTKMIDIRTVYFTLVLGACIYSTQLIAARLPDSFSAQYVLTKGFITLGKTRRTMQKIGDNQYEFKSDSRPSGVGKMLTQGEIHEKSTWTYHNNTLRPMLYSYFNSSSKKTRKVELKFDWQNNIVTNIINGDPWKMELMPGVQDKLLYQLTLMLDLNKGKRHLKYIVADGGTEKTYVANIVGEEEIETDIGVFNTLKIVRRHHDKRRTTLWCAPELMYLPVQIEQAKEDGSRVRATLFELKGIAIPDQIEID